MNITKARKIARDVAKCKANDWSVDDLSDAFARLDLSVNQDWSDADKPLRKAIWDHYGKAAA